ncbi:MAG: hypothetical protein IT316_09070 [Anaerolineales bacterium]|nr:hypothetical protein [Anaerolineales bacterium]
MFRSLIQTIQRHPYPAHSFTLAVMILASALGFIAANAGAQFWIFAALGLFIFANLVELVIK